MAVLSVHNSRVRKHYSLGHGDPATQNSLRRFGIEGFNSLPITSEMILNIVKGCSVLRCYLPPPQKNRFHSVGKNPFESTSEALKEKSGWVN